MTGMDTGDLYTRTSHTSSSSSRTTQSSSRYYYPYTPVKASPPLMPGSPEGSGGSSVNGGHYSDYGGERRVARVGSDSQWAGPQSAHYEGFGYQPTSSSHYYHYDEESGNGPYPYPSRLDLRYHYSDTPREESPEQRPFYQPPLSLSYPTYSPPAPYASPSCTFYGRESDGLDEIERAAEQRMQEASAMVSSTHHYRLPSNGPMVKMFRVFLDKQLNDSKLGAVLSEISLPALGDDEYGAGLRVKTVMEAEEMGEVGMLARWNGRGRRFDRDVRVGDVIVSVVDGSPVDTLGPKASGQKLMEKLKTSLKCNTLIILDVLREAPPLEVCDWPQTQQTMIACLESMEKNLHDRKDQAMTWFVGDVAPIILSPTSHLWCPLCECKQQSLAAYLGHFESSEHFDKRREISSKYDSRWAKLPLGVSKHYWFEYCYGFTSIVDVAELDPYAEFCNYSPIES